MRVDLAARVERSCARHTDVKRLRLAILDDLAAAIPFAGHVWVLTDPVTGVGTIPLATVPGLPLSRIPDLIRSRYLTPVNRWNELIGSKRFADGLRHATHDEPSRSRLWREILADLGAGDVASVVFADRFGCWGWLDLWRFPPAGPFADEEIGRLLAIRPAVTTALRTGQARNFGRPRTAGEGSGPAVVILDDDLHVRGQTARAGHRLHRLNPPDPGSDGRPSGVAAIPAAAYNVAAQLIAREHGIDDAPARSRVYLDDLGWLTLEADRMAADETTTDRDIAVSIEESGLADRREMFSRAVGLTHREDEVLGLLLAGHDTRAMALELVVSEYTVVDHVKAVLAKAGCPGRQALLATVAG